ncbi:MAG: helix-hairpin-helix domain-containing protein [Dehalococcoidia bacterium]
MPTEPSERLRRPSRPRAATVANGVLLLLALVAFVLLATRSGPDAGVEVERRHPPPGIDEIRVEVRGAVGAPGVVIAAPGDRVGDILARAGGVLAEADLRAVNLALRVRDQDVIDVPLAGAGGPRQGVAHALIDLNTATQDDLEALPGIGPVRARAIIDARPFVTSEELLERGVIPAGVYEDIRLLVNASAAPP